MKANDGSGPELLQCSDDAGNPHTESLTSTLTEHRQHLISMQVTEEFLRSKVLDVQEMLLSNLSLILFFLKIKISRYHERK